MNDNTCSDELQTSIIERTLWLRRWVKSREGQAYLDWWQRLVAPGSKRLLDQGTGPAKSTEGARLTNVNLDLSIMERSLPHHPHDTSLPHPVDGRGPVQATNVERDGYGLHEYSQGLPPEVIKNFTKGYTAACNGDIYYVTPELGDQAALRMIRRTRATLRPHELITPTGIMFLPQTANLNFQKVFGYLGQEDRSFAVGWNCVGDAVTLFWICDQNFNNDKCRESWDLGETFWTTDEWSPEICTEEWGGSHWSDYDNRILLPFHYWACMGEGTYGPLIRPDQPGAPTLPIIDVEVWRNENQTSTEDRFVLAEEQVSQYEAELWTMIAFACESIKMLGEEYRYVETANPIRSQARDTQRTWIKAGITKTSKPINVYTLREGHLRREGKYLSRGPLETRHHRRAHWRGTPGKGGDLTCRHQFSSHPDDYNWRVCVPCGRVEHKVVEAEVGPEGAPWVASTRIGVLRR